MKLTIPFYLIVPMLFLYTTPSDAVFSIAKISHKLFASFKSFTDLSKTADNNNYKQQLSTAFNNIHDICLKLDKESSSTTDVKTTIEALAEERRRAKISDKDKEIVQNITNELKKISNLFHNDFLRYVSDTEMVKNDKISLFIDEVASILNTTRFIRDWATQRSNNKIQARNSEDIFRVTIKYFKLQPENNRCGGPSLYSGLYNLYKEMVLGVTKGYIMVFMAHQFDRMKSTNHGQIIHRQQQKIFKECEKSIKKMTDSAKVYLELIDSLQYKKVRLCDPKFWDEGWNYIRVKNYVLSYKPNIRYVGFTKKNKVPMKSEFECINDKVYHNPVNPQGVVFSRSCPEIFSDNFHRNPSCNHYALNDFSAKSIKNLIGECVKNGFTSDLEALCTCDKQSDPDRSIRKLSLRSYLTNAAYNRVIIGVRFVVRNSIIGIQIREAKLVDGIIDNTTMRWITNDGQQPEKGPDFARLSYDMRSFDLDDIELPFSYLVTGVKFFVTEDKHIGLAVRGSKMYDDEHNTFASILDKWFFPETKLDSDKPGILLMKESKNSNDTDVESIELSKSGISSVNLTKSEHRRDRAKMAIMPFFDSRDVVSEPPSALGGLGILYKSYPGYDGFLALRDFFHYLTRVSSFLLAALPFLSIYFLFSALYIHAKIYSQSNQATSHSKKYCGASFIT